MNLRVAKKLAAAMEKELKRSMEGLKAPRHPKPYFISYLYRDMQTYNVWGRYGSLGLCKRDHTRNCYVDVRTGDYRYDQVTKGGLNDNSEDAESVELIDMPIDNDEDGLRFALWRLTDAKYREAVSQYHGRKSRDISYLDENRALPSFTRSAQQIPSSEKLQDADFDEDYFRDLVLKASRVFKKYEKIKSSYCDYSCELVTKIYLSSEGVLKIWQTKLYSLSAYMWYHSKKVNQDYTLVYHTTDKEELPSLKDFCGDIRKKIAMLYELEEADSMKSFAGPVLLAPKPAGLFIHEVVGHRLEGSRLLSDSEGRTFKDRTGQKIMNESLSIYDDPGLTHFEGKSLVGHFPYDDEGVPSQRTSLVENGILKGFLSTRAPLKKRSHQSNGHARNQSYERPISRMGNLIVEPSKGLSWQELKAELIKEIKRQKKKFGMILIEVEGGETETDAYDFQAFLGQVTKALKVYANGEEHLVRGVDFVGTPLSSLSNIIAVGSETELDNGYCGAESGTVPVSTVAPALLLSNLELQLKSPAKVTEYALSLPWVKGKKS